MVKMLIGAAFTLLFFSPLAAQDKPEAAPKDGPLRPWTETENEKTPMPRPAVKDKSVSALVDTTETGAAKKKVSTLRIYKGKDDGVRTYSLRLTPGASWRVLWKIDVRDGQEKASMSLNVRTPSDPGYVQGLKKDIKKVEETAFGVINICQEGAADFTLDLETRGAKWDVQIQQLK